MEGSAGGKGDNAGVERRREREREGGRGALIDLPIDGIGRRAD